MAKALLIAEKPSLMRAIQDVYTKYGHKDQIDFATFAGHVVELKEPGEYKLDWKKWNLSSLPIIPDEFKFKPSQSTRTIYDGLKQMIERGTYDYLICATDAGREGNLIFAAFYETLNTNIPVWRWWNQSLTEKPIKDSLDNLIPWEHPSQKNLTDASFLRAYFDQLIGINFTRAVTLKNGANKAINIGRIMTPIISLVVHREKEIKNFKKETTYGISAVFNDKENEDSIYEGTYIDSKGTSLFFKTKKELNEFIDKNNLKNETAKVDSVSKTTVSYTAPELPSLVSLQNEANEEFGYTLNETLEIAQSLYEVGYISYPRSDASALPADMVNYFDVYLSTCVQHPKYGKYAVVSPDAKARVAKNKKYIDDSKVSDHYAIIPTEIAPNYNSLTNKEKNIYDLVVRRFVGIFQDPEVLDKTVVITKIKDIPFKSSGIILVKKGFMELYNKSLNNTFLPDLTEGQLVRIKEINQTIKQTTPPKRFTDKTLNIAMEHAGRFVEDEESKKALKMSKGIGTVATRGSTVEKCIKIEMLQRKGKNIIPTEFGTSVIDYLENEDIISVKLTADWETKLQEVVDGTLTYDNFYKDMIKYVSEQTIKFTNKDGGIMDKNTLGKCPICGKQVIDTDKYYFCCNYRGRINENEPCGFIIGKDYFGTPISRSDAKLLIEGKPTKPIKLKNKQGQEYQGQLIYNVAVQKVQVKGNQSKNSNSLNNHEVEKTGEVCPKCGHDMVFRTGKYGKFEACSNFPSCKYIKPKNKDTAPAEKTGEACPKCGSDMVFRKNSSGKFEACSNYPTCKYIKPNKQETTTTGETCPECGSPIIIRNGRFGRFKACSNYPACKNIIK